MYTVNRVFVLQGDDRGVSRARHCSAFGGCVLSCQLTAGAKTRGVPRVRVAGGGVWYTPLCLYVCVRVGDENTELGEPFTLEDVFQLSPRKFVAQWLPGM